MADRVAGRPHPPPTCTRCSATATRENPLDRLTLHYDNDHMESLRGDLCRACSVALVRWLDPTADVRTARLPAAQVTHTVVAPHRQSPTRATRTAPQTTVVEEDVIAYADESDIDAKELVRQIDSLLAGENGIDYAWASDSLDGIRETITKTKPWRATTEQQRAVDNIEEGGIRGARRGRY